MKKILSVIILSAFLVAGNPRPAQAIVLDPGQIAAKIAEIVQDIADAVQTGIQEINKVKQMAAQGFNYQALIDKAAQFATKYAIDYVTTKILTKRFKEVEGDTNAQNKKVLEKDKKNYEEATTALYDKQLEVIDQEINRVSSAQVAAETKRTEARANAAKAQAAYEAETSPETKNQKMIEYMQWTAEAEKWNNDYWELERKYYGLVEDQKKLLLEQKETITTDDNQYKLLEERINAMADADDKNLITVDPGTTEWDKVNMDDYDINKRYDEFMQQYFFDPKELGNGGQGGVVAHQTRMDKIMRQRRYLVVNSAAHLMQVAASMRRLIPVEQKKNKEMFTSIGQDEGELAAMNVYSSTRVENARALLMYAKLLCAKLQYETARDLIKSDVQREMINNSEFDLEKYILDSADVEAMMKKFQYGIKAEEESENLNFEYYDTYIAPIGQF